MCRSPPRKPHFYVFWLLIIQQCGGECNFHKQITRDRGGAVKKIKKIKCRTKQYMFYGFALGERFQLVERAEKHQQQPIPIRDQNGTLCKNIQCCISILHLADALI